MLFRFFMRGFGDEGFKVFDMMGPRFRHKEGFKSFVYILG